MKYLQIQKTVSDGRTFNFHKVNQILSPISETQIQVQFGSWYELQQLLNGGTPDITQNLILTKDSNETEEYFYSHLLEQVKEISGWESAELIDLSKPEPLPVED